MNNKPISQQLEEWVKKYSIEQNSDASNELNKIIYEIKKIELKLNVQIVEKHKWHNKYLIMFEKYSKLLNDDLLRGKQNDSDFRKM